MLLNGTTLPNPTGVNSDSRTVSARNLALGGVINYDHSQNDARNIVHTIQVQWAGITAAELASLRAEWVNACNDYVSMTIPGLQVRIGGSLVNTVDATALEDAGLDVAFDQAWDSAGNGPVLYGATATFITQPAAM